MDIFKVYKISSATLEHLITKEVDTGQDGVYVGRGSYLVADRYSTENGVSVYTVESITIQEWDDDLIVKII